MMNGGRLLILSDFCPGTISNINPVAQRFGVIIDPANTISLPFHSPIIKQQSEKVHPSGNVEMSP
jgi:hypothetical protein